MIDTMTFAEIIGELDPDQKKAVNVDANCVVTAGAGSGKTTVLSYRFLWMLIRFTYHDDSILNLLMRNRRPEYTKWCIFNRLHTTDTF